MRSIESKAKTMEEAVTLGLEKLGVSFEDVNIDILEEGHKGFLGLLGAKPVVVRLTVKEDVEEANVLKDVKLGLNPEKAGKAAPAKPVKAPAAKQPAEKPAPKAEKPVEKPVEKKAPVVPADGVAPEAKAEEFLRNVTKLMGVDVTIDSKRDDEGNVRVDMHGDTLGILIGRRGETLDALQYLTSLYVNRGQEGYTRVTLDTENYRAKREEALTRLNPERLGGFYAWPATLWFRLDDAAKIYPLSMKHGQMSVFRLAAVLKEPVKPELLQIALHFTIQRFPGFATTVRKGFFWHYLDQTKRRYCIQPETDIPVRPLKIAASGSQSFRVLYYENRISAEFFHILTDATGGMCFLKTLLAEYLRLLGTDCPCGDGILDVTRPPLAGENENAFPAADRPAPELPPGPGAAASPSGRTGHTSGGPAGSSPHEWSLPAPRFREFPAAPPPGRGGWATSFPPRALDAAGAGPRHRRWSAAAGPRNPGPAVPRDKPGSRSPLPAPPLSAAPARPRG